MSTNHIKLFNKKEQEYYALRTGIVVDIQNIGKNTELLAIKEKKHVQEIKPGVWLRKDAITFKDGNFTNVYDFYWNPNQIGIVPAIHSSHRPFSLYEKAKRDTTIIAAINGSFYFLTDVADRKPHDLPYDFCMRNNTIVGLPSSDEPIMYVQNGKLQTKEILAKGTIRIGNEVVTWTGAKSNELKSTGFATLYNSKCANIIKVRHKKTNVQIGILDNATIRTPQDTNVFDIVVVKNKKGDLKIKRINVGGGTHYYSGIFILQMTGSPKRFSVGDSVTPLVLDDLDLQSIASGITIGKKINDPYFLTSELGENRDARSVIAKDTKGFIHFMVFDGSKYIPGFHGVSAKEITPLFSKRKFKWSYFLDGGGSSRLIVREHRRMGVFANQFAFVKQKNGMFLWDWRRARRIASSISLHSINN